MPYEGEFAQYKPLRRLVKSERVNKLLGSYRVWSSSDHANALQLLEPIYIPSSQWAPTWIIGIDGSHAEVEIKNGFPGAEASYVTVASVLLNVEKVRQLDQQRPVNPKEFRTTEKAESIDCALPGCNVICEGESSAKASLRKSIFEVFESVQMSSEGETLLDTYEALLKYKPITNSAQKCPYEDCPGDQDFKRDVGKYSCSCALARSLYSTDALRIHERMNPVGTNGAIFAEIMQVWERIWVVHILRTMEVRKWLSSLSRVAIVLDGPLAVFGQPAWISQAIYQELSRINAIVRKSTGGKDLLLLGIEKTGTFVQHFEDLDKNESGESGAFPHQSVGLLSDSYIKKNIIFSDSERLYGDATYFGRKVFYKTRSGARIVATLPFLSEHHKDTTTADFSQYPRLTDAVSLLDQIVSSRFPNAIVPLVSANAEAAIPLRLGNKVLEKLAKELMGEN
jgi:hypothetical protein